MTSGHYAPVATPDEVFLRGVWHGIIPRTDDINWVDRLAALPATDEPLGDLGPLVRRMLRAGIAAADIARFAQIERYEVAFGFCYHLADPIASYEGLADDGERELSWCLFLVDPDSGEPIAQSRACMSRS